MDLGGKSILICHTIINHIMGSTVVTLELAQYFKATGAMVVVYASFISDPMLHHFTSSGIQVIDDGTPVQPQEFDFVWVNSQVLPLSFCDALASTPVEALPKFIFMHMSALDIAPDEHPYISGLEEQLSSCSVFVSQSTLESLRGHYNHLPPTALFENPAPQEFMTARSAQSVKHSMKFLVVSNHAPPELRHASKLLQKDGHTVTFMGAHESNYELLQPSHLAEHDAVITIGKTVPYCLVSGTPVYVYDHFGGPGYLDADSWKDSANRNHCGAGYGKKTAAEIARQLVSEHQKTVIFQNELLDVFHSRYRLDAALENIFNRISTQTVVPLQPHAIESLCSAQRFASRYYRRWGEFDQLHAEHIRLQADLRDANLQIKFAKADTEALRQSWSFRLGQLAIKPVSKLLALVARKR